MNLMFGSQGLRDDRARARIQARILRLSLGNPGDVKPVGEGISEMRIVTMGRATTCTSGCAAKCRSCCSAAETSQHKTKISKRPN
jgi:putative component of toxin-antitoxin plasmid stabilization module